ncbi:MAG TPA: general stress protein, partial [Chloroflexia bacterium]|nr:general stress protein [Chloroflexia bacterium]
MATVVGLFDNRNQAQMAVEQLRAMNIAAGDISVAMQSSTAGTTEVVTETGAGAGAGAVTGAVGGGVLGGLAGLLVGVGALAIPGIGPVVAAGPLATTLIGAGVGAATGGR